jgi:anti-anti-sigma regulatory factor
MSDSAATIVSTGRRPTQVTLRVSGELDRPGIARLRSELAQWRDAGALELIVDLSAVTGSGPTLARVLAWARIQLRGNGGDLVVIGGGDPVLADLAAATVELEAGPSRHRDIPASYSGMAGRGKPVSGNGGPASSLLPW